MLSDLPRPRNACYSRAPPPDHTTHSSSTFKAKTVGGRVPKSRVLQPRHASSDRCRVSPPSGTTDERDWRGSHASRLLMAPTRPSATESAASASKLWARKFKR